MARIAAIASVRNLGVVADPHGSAGRDTGVFPVRRMLAAWAGAWGCGCVAMAPPPPVATLGAPETAAPGHAQAALGVGGGASLFPGAHSGGIAVFGRYRRGFTERLDLGGDVLAGQHAEY